VVKPFLSLMMIARGSRAEELSRALASVVDRPGGPMVDELVIADTGTEPGVADVAARVCSGKVPVKIVPFVQASSFSFSAARNAALAQVSGEWALWLDSDDIIPQADEQQAELDKGAGATKLSEGVGLRDILRGLPADIVVVNSPYHYDHDPVTGAVTAVIPRERIIRVGAGRWEWLNPIHENLFLNATSFDGWIMKHEQPRNAFLAGFVIVHRPADPNHAQNSRVRNKAIFESEIVRMGERVHPQALLHLAELYREEGDCTAALDLFKRVARDTPPSGDVVQFGYMARIFAARMLAGYGRLDECIAMCAEAIPYAPAFADARYVLAAALYNKGDIARAASYLSEAAGRDFLGAVAGYMSPGERTSYYLLEAKVFFEVGQHDLAARAATTAMDRSPNCAEVAGEFRIIMGKIKRAKMQAAFETLFEGLRDNTEMFKADALLDHCVPYFMESDALIADMRSRLQKQFVHMSGRIEFAKAYEGNDFWKPFPEDILADMLRGKLLPPQPRARWLAQRLAEKGAKSCVELGCADGYITLWLASRFPEKQFLGVDIDPQVIACANERAQKFGLTNARFEVADCVFEPANADNRGKFDAVAYFEVIEHVPHPAYALRLAASYMKTNGTLFVSTPYGNFDNGMTKTAEGRPSHHVRAYGFDQLVSDARAGHFSVKALTANTEIMIGYTGWWHLELENAASEKKERVSFIAPGAPLPWGPHTGREVGIGGSEEALYHIAKRLAAAGHPVDVYTNLEREECVEDGVSWLNTRRLALGGVALDRGGIAVFWRCPQFELPRAKFDRSFVWLHDTSYGPVEQRQWDRFEKICVVSQTHAELIAATVGLSPDRFVVTPNGIDPKDFARSDVKRVPRRLVYGSSPDRGLETLLTLWPRVRERFPDASLRVLYGWETAEQLRALGNFGAAPPGFKARILKLADQPGVEWVGRVNWKQVAEEFLAADVWAYPSGFFEVSCITAMKAMAGGAWPVTSNVGALPETLGVPDVDAVTMCGGDPETDVSAREEWLSLLTAVLDGVGPSRLTALYATREYLRRDMQVKACTAFSWDMAALAWKDVFAGAAVEGGVV
jgi:glycosyltransferase involved in cell wall biosynthesis/tetratricopeptide (TPR) repeat protein